MKLLLMIAFLVTGVFRNVAEAQSSAPAPILPDSIRWVSPPNAPGVRTAWVLGAEQRSEIYVLRVKLAKGTRIPPHIHPDERNTTVLAGTIYVGFGETFDDTKIVAIPAGAVYIAPANVPHYVWAKDESAMYQEVGVGPTGTAFIRR